MALVNLNYGTAYSDLCYGFNVFWRRHLPILQLDAATPLPNDGDGRLWGDGFEVETLIVIRATVAGLAVVEVPSFERSRIHGVSNLNAFSDGLRVLRTVITERRSTHKTAVKATRQAASAAVQTRPAAFVLEEVASRPAQSDGRDRWRSDMTVSRISVVICVYTEDRWDQICDAIGSIHAQSLPSSQIIVVVDHNPALRARLASAFPDVTVEANREARGLSGARNTGVSLAEGDMVVFLDDDAVAEPDWLKFLADSFADPTTIGVGGRTLPRWEIQRPRWFPAEFDWVVGCSYIGMPSSRAPVRNLLGGNMAFRRSAFDIVEGFRSGIGRIAGGERPLGCEETEFCIRLTQRSPGMVLLFDDRAVVHHFVPAARTRFSYFASRCYAEGLSKAQVAVSVGSNDGLSAERHYATRILPRGIARGVTDLLRGDISGPSRAGAIIAGLAFTAVGYAEGSFRQGAQRGRPSVVTVGSPTRDDDGAT